MPNPLALGLHARPTCLWSGRFAFGQEGLQDPRDFGPHSYHSKQLGSGAPSRPNLIITIIYNTNNNIFNISNINYNKNNNIFNINNNNKLTQV